MLQKLNNQNYTNMHLIPNFMALTIYIFLNPSMMWGNLFLGFSCSNTRNGWFFSLSCVDHDIRRVLMSLKHWERVIAVSLRGPFDFVQETILMLKNLCFVFIEQWYFGIVNSRNCWNCHVFNSRNCSVSSTMIYMSIQKI